MLIKVSLHFKFSTTDNKDEYKAFIIGHNSNRDGVKHVKLWTYS